MSFQETIRWRGAPIEVDAVRAENKTFIISGGLIKVAHLKKEWLQDIDDPKDVIHELKTGRERVDILRFWQRVPDTQAKWDYYKEWCDVAAIPIADYKHWFEKQTSPKARNKIRKTAKYGVSIEQTELTDALVRGIMEIFNQSPVRRGKRFWHYGKSFDQVKQEMSLDLHDSIFITAYHKQELIGFVKMQFTDRYGMLTLILDKTKHRDKAPMNGMIAKAVEVCAARKVPYIVYMLWRRGDHGEFQESMGFKRITIPEYFVPLSFKGQVGLRLGLHRGLRGLIPEQLMLQLLALRGKWYAWKYRRQMAEKDE